jgi:hypothetical protein
MIESWQLDNRDLAYPDSEGVAQATIFNQFAWRQ